MTYRKGDKITIKCNGQSVPGWVELASDNQVSLLVCWDVMQHEVMIAGHVGAMALLRHPDGVYRSIHSGDRVDLEVAQ